MKVIKKAVLEKTIILIIILISLNFSACKRQKEDKNHNSKEYLNNKYWENLSDFKNVKITTKSNGVNLIRFFDSDGILRQKGLAKDTIPVGWWEYFNSEGNIIEKKEFLSESESQFINQQIIYTNDQQIDTLKSLFFTVYLNDTLTLGKNIGRIALNTFNKTYDSRYSYVIIENEYENGLVQMDTFGALNDEVVEFGVFAANLGNNTINGVIYEEILLEETEADSENVNIDLVKIKKFFQIDFFVEDLKN